MSHSERNVLDLQAFWTAKPTSQCDNIFIHDIHHTKSDTRSETFDHAPILHCYWQLRWNITGIVLYTIFIWSPTTDTTSVAVINRAREKGWEIHFERVEQNRERRKRNGHDWAAKAKKHSTNRFMVISKFNRGQQWIWLGMTFDFYFLPRATPLSYSRVSHH